MNYKIFIIHNLVYFIYHNIWSLYHAITHPWVFCPTSWLRTRRPWSVYIFLAQWSQMLKESVPCHWLRWLLSERLGFSGAITWLSLCRKTCGRWECHLGVFHRLFWDADAELRCGGKGFTYRNDLHPGRHQDSRRMRPGRCPLGGEINWRKRTCCLIHVENSFLVGGAHVSFTFYIFFVLIQVFL